MGSDCTLLGLFGSKLELLRRATVPVKNHFPELFRHVLKFKLELVMFGRRHTLGHFIARFVQLLLNTVYHHMVVVQLFLCQKQLFLCRKELLDKRRLTDI